MTGIKRGSMGDSERVKKVKRQSESGGKGDRAGDEIGRGRRAQTSFSLQGTEAQDSCGSCYCCTMCLIAHYYRDAPIIIIHCFSKSVYLSLFS